MTGHPNRRPDRADWLQTCAETRPLADCKRDAEELFR